VVNGLGNASMNNERIIQILETQLAESNKQIEALTEQVRQLTKALYG
jgi:transposase